MNAIQSAMGMVKSLLPVGAGQALPVAPKLPNFESFLAGFVSMLHDLLGQSTTQTEAVDISEDLGLKHEAEDLELTPGMQPRKESGPLRDFNVEDPQVREGLRREIEKRLEELPYENVAVQVDEIRRFLQQVDARGQVGDDQAGQPGTVVDEIMRALNMVRKQADVQADVSQQPTPPPAPVQEALQEKVAPVSFETALRQTTRIVEPPVARPEAAPPVEPASASAPPVQPPVASRPETLLSSPPVAEKLPDFTVQEVSAPAPEPEAEAHAPSAPRIPTAVTVASVSEAARSEGAATARSDSAVRGVGDIRTAQGRPTSLPAPAEGSSQDERAEFIERIVKAARLTQSRGMARIKIALNPPHLGNLKVDLSVRQHVLSGTLQAENVAARDLIVSHLQTLKDTLASQGIHVGEFQVQVENAFDHARRDADHGKAHSAPPGFERGRSEERLSAVESRLRSARLQLIDMVA